VELRHLRYFVAVAEELHFSRAAQRLHIAQSPLSQQIRQLEDEIGLDLFARTTRKVELTAAGAAFLTHARRALHEASRGIEVAQRAARGELGFVRIGFVDSAAYKLLPRILPVFQRAHPDVGIELRELTTAEQLARLPTEIDVGIVRDADPHDDVELTPLVNERLIAAVALGHPLAARGVISLADLSDDEFIVFPRARVPHGVDRFVALCRSCGFSPRIGQRALQHATVLGLVETGYGVALMPESVRDSARPGIAMLDLSEPDATSQLALLAPVEACAPLVAVFAAVALQATAALRGSSTHSWE
jgi:DNA-binding transcriptional LysR family regulator